VDSCATIGGVQLVTCSPQTLSGQNQHIQSRGNWNPSRVKCRGEEPVNWVSEWMPCCQMEVSSFQEPQLVHSCPLVHLVVWPHPDVFYDNLPLHHHSNLTHHICLVSEILPWRSADLSQIQSPGAAAGGNCHQGDQYSQTPPVGIYRCVMMYWTCSANYK